MKGPVSELRLFYLRSFILLSDAFLKENKVLFGHSHSSNLPPVLPFLRSTELFTAVCKSCSPSPALWAGECRAAHPAPAARQPGTRVPATNPKGWRSGCKELRPEPSVWWLQHQEEPDWACSLMSCPAWLQLQPLHRVTSEFWLQDSTAVGCTQSVQDEGEKRGKGKDTKEICLQWT